MSNENLVFYLDALADEGMRLNFAASSDYRTNLDFNKWPDLSFGAQLASIKIDQVGKGNTNTRA